MTHPFFEICQDRLFVQPWAQTATKRLPGINPLAWDDWLIQDSAFAAQMAYRDYLIAERFGVVHAHAPQADEAALELLEMVVARLDYPGQGAALIRPDGVAVEVDRSAPMQTLGRLVQQDFCILLRDVDEHVLRSAILCFPASWSLAEKFDRPMRYIHVPVTEYSDRIATSVQRMFDAMRPDRPMWRANFLLYSNPDLHQPRREDERRSVENGRQWVRVERQSLVKLPGTGAVVFGIHNQVVPTEVLSPEEQSAFRAAIAEKHAPIARDGP